MEWPPDAPPLAAVWDAVATWMAALPDTEGVSTNRAVAEAFGDAYEVTRLLPLRRHIKAILQQQLAHGQMADLEFYRAPPRGGGTPGSPPTGRTLTKGGRGSGGAKKPAAAAAVTIPAAAPLPAHDGDTSEDDDAARLARGRRRVVYVLCCARQLSYFGSHHQHTPHFSNMQGAIACAFCALTLTCLQHGRSSTHGGRGVVCTDARVWCEAEAPCRQGASQRCCSCSCGGRCGWLQ